ncbi:MAG: ParM/StbA family protein [Clostridiales bacterium]|jgi:plasmid segregation protein ParM|nr:ParM/StbA family protein [Clostridiales bacterium]
MIIGIDIGYGYVKAAGNAKQVIFPTIIGDKKESTGLSDYFGSTDDYIVSIRSEGEEKEYYVGDIAITNGFARKWNSDKTVDLEYLKVFCGTAFAGLLEASDETEIEIGVGLPINFFKVYGEKLKKMLDGISIEIKINNGSYKLFNIKKVKIYVQGLGAYFSSIYDENGAVKNMDLLNKSCGFIEIGYRTVDYFIVLLGKKSMTVPEAYAQTLEKEGINYAFQDVGRSLLGEYKTSFDIIEIEKSILWRNGNLEIDGGDTININKYYESAIEKLAETIKDKINIIWQEHSNRLPIIYISGGGGDVLYKYLFKFYKQCRLQENAQFANALGYLANMKKDDLNEGKAVENTNKNKKDNKIPVKAK